MGLFGKKKEEKKTCCCCSATTPKMVKSEDKCPGKYSKAPREIHIYYKLIDKQPIPEKKYTNNPTCEDC